jgi:hypothetical protein
MAEQNAVTRAMNAAKAEASIEHDVDKSPTQALADVLGITYQAVAKFEQQGYLPLARAKVVASRYSIPLRDLVRKDIREAMAAA